MNFRSYEIKDICKIKSGKRLPKGTDFSEKPTKHKYIRARDIKNGKIDGSDLGYISEEIHKKIARYIVNTNDIIITIAGTIGEVALVSKKFDGVNLTENAVRLTEFSKDVCPEFLAYILKSPERKEYMEQVAGGSAQPKLGIYKIEAIKVDLPDIQIQHKIADILSAYDDLIENNQKQTKLLEEAAQRLYKEWFVDLRFPGHENTKIVDGVPEGWKKNCAEKFFEITIGKTPPRTEKRCFTTGKNGIPWVSIADMGNSGMFVLNTAENLTDDAIKQYNVKVIPKNTVLLSFKLTVGRVAIAPNDICTNEAIAHFKGRRECEREYTYFYLKNFHYDELGSTSSISKAVNSKIIKAMPFIMPSEKLLKEYSSKTKDIFDLIICKQKMDNNLKIARDRILHKLMSGEVEV